MLKPAHLIALSALAALAVCPAAYGEDPVARAQMFWQFGDDPYFSTFFRDEAYEKARLRREKLKDANERRKREKLEELEQQKADDKTPEFQPEDFRDLDLSDIQGREVVEKYFSDLRGAADRSDLPDWKKARDVEDLIDRQADRARDHSRDDDDARLDRVSTYSQDMVKGGDDKKTGAGFFGYFGNPRAVRADLGQPPKVIQEVPDDWVPDKLDPVNNGGFTIAPDNGSPVPYHLNGHVDIQRVRPWNISAD